MFRNIRLLAVAVITLASLACAKPPQTQADAANAALAKATGAGAAKEKAAGVKAAVDQAIQSRPGGSRKG